MQGQKKDSTVLSLYGEELVIKFNPSDSTISFQTKSSTLFVEHGEDICINELSKKDSCVETYRMYSWVRRNDLLKVDTLSVRKLFYSRTIQRLGHIYDFMSYLNDMNNFSIPFGQEVMKDTNNCLTQNHILIPIYHLDQLQKHEPNLVNNKLFFESLNFLPELRPLFVYINVNTQFVCVIN